MLVHIGEIIERGAITFLKAEYKIMSFFIVGFSIIIYVVVDILGAVTDSGAKYMPYATISFIIGSITSMFCGYIGMKIAVMANYRTTYKAIFSLEGAFQTAFRSGCVMGFAMVSLSLLILAILIIAYRFLFQPNFDLNTKQRYEVILDLLSGYGLGGSSMALFGRVGGGIYTKAADVGADLVGKIEEGLDEDSPRNPATIADNVGDNVGDIAGMGSDLFGSFAEATCAALVLTATANDYFTAENPQVIWYPLVISALGIIGCLISSIIGIWVYKVQKLEQIMKALNLQLLLSTVLTLAMLWVVSWIMLPSHFKFKTEDQQDGADWEWFHPCLCTTLGLISGFLIGLSTDYYTSSAHKPVQEMALKCQSGAAINIIYGLAVGYLSTIVPVFLLAISIIGSVWMLDMFGVALAA